MTQIRKASPAPAQGAARVYSRAELASDMFVHLAALVMALAAVPVLITLTAVWRGTAAEVAAVSIYGGTLVMMLTASLLYNHVRHPDLTALFRRIDMSAIHLKIAGTYTPFALLSGAGGGLLTAVWGAAFGAAALTLFKRRLPSGLAVAMCLCTGWAVVIGGWDLLAALPLSVCVLMVVGGVLYSLGTPFLMASRLRFHNTIWHGIVVAASIVFFVAVFMVAAAVPMP
ncbi:PAQR family membrane homeostasis protein TrhA [Mameliella sediminis]|uniref:PAQR family membrane homeostasis protein TrhA n=1 Tax=Mameliella sediminis TaxID=2836866 RepID=UPI001C43A305|nr:hemolysin III family protein [Mameliella sediminis]MBV7395115.1 hemolysin III family protein [Mameliella sediminis]MBY6159689.1 hemolysin III family protein [Mameliella alba]MBY6168160.1 hemolysin III family protein [Mameliella alba]MBY6173181.1 hemolysin III family protein [Mameliella alba]